MHPFDVRLRLTEEAEAAGAAGATGGAARPSAAIELQGEVLPVDVVKEVNLPELGAAKGTGQLGGSGGGGGGGEGWRAEEGLRPGPIG